MTIHRNPYRIRKPKRDILWRGRLFACNEKGGLKSEGYKDFNAVLTQSHLWLWSELAIPLLSITKITSLNDGAALRIAFHQALTQQDLVLHLSAINFFSRVDKGRLASLMTELRQAWQTDCLRSGKPNCVAALDAVRREARCEVCGSHDATLLESGYLFSFGLAPFFWLDEWTPSRPYVCQRHAIAATCRNNFITSLIGFLGIPGIFTGPYFVLQNSLRLRKRFSVGIPGFVAALLCGIVVPVLTWISLWQWLAGNCLEQQAL